MNNPRRKKLNDIIAALNELKEYLEAMMEEEEAYRDNIPENLQGSERFEKSDEACDALSYALDSIDEVIENIKNAVE
ncbi:MAG: hypothetical protein IJ168_02000 [Eubacterium sp.]|nr:hypothetical protein [Eubacterium sp.]